MIEQYGKSFPIIRIELSHRLKIGTNIVKNVYLHIFLMTIVINCNIEFITYSK